MAKEWRSLTTLVTIRPIYLIHLDNAMRHVPGKLRVMRKRIKSQKVSKTNR
jgi:hypothetical protein